ncbi:MAG: methylated-DNA--[protein]-cysteine S-methyltransferase [Desulfopila sp.]
MNVDQALYYCSLATEIGELILAAGEKGLRYAFFRDGEGCNIPYSWVHAPEKLADGVVQMEEYLHLKRRRFDVPLDPEGTPFQRRVWQALLEIPHGTTISYGELARRIGCSKGCRAVGNANGKNPLVIIQPCHRVIAANGAIGGFSSGIERKKFLLELEKGGH